MTIILYGIKQCDTMKRARQWLDSQGVQYQFHDYQRSGIERERLLSWCRVLVAREGAGKGWETLLNRAGTTFRKLPDAAKTQLDEHKAVELMCASPSMIKRPVLEYARGLLVGFKPEIYAAHAAELTAV